MAAKSANKERLDKILVDRGLCDTRSQAQGMILSGNVLVNEQRVDKPGTLLPLDAVIRLKEKLKYVSRGGLKLEKALQTFPVSVIDRVCIDVGASTGGFTDCLLQAGARKVWAVDVGYGQLDWKLRQDPRVGVYEKTHIAELAPETLPERPDLAVMDVSFISLKKVLPRAIACLDPQAVPQWEVITLVKPQFEYLDYCEIKGFNGVVTDFEDVFTILSGVTRDILAVLPDWGLVGVVESPLHGPKGNREFLFYWRPQAHILPGTAVAPGEETAEILRRLVFEDS